MKFCLFRKPRAVYFTHWILALMDSLAALVIRCRRYVMMFSNRRLSIRAGEIEGYGAINLLEGKRRKRLDYAFGRFTTQISIDERVQGHTRLPNVITTVPLLNVLDRHRG